VNGSFQGAEIFKSFGVEYKEENGCIKETSITVFSISSKRINL
jgi:hypothetical protein